MHFLRCGDFEGADDAEAEELRVGEVPEALGEFGVLGLPVGLTAAAGGGAAVVGGGMGTMR